MRCTEVLQLQSPTQYAVQRKHQRYVFSESLVIIRSFSPTDMRRSPGICTEISKGGLSAIVTEPLKVEEEVELSFSISGDRIQVKAVVRNQFQFRQGFEFVGLSDENRDKIQAACTSLKPYEGGWY